MVLLQLFGDELGLIVILSKNFMFTFM